MLQVIKIIKTACRGRSFAYKMEDNQDILEVIRKEVDKTAEFVVTKGEFEGENCLLIYHRKLFNHQPLGPTSRCRIFISPNGKEFVANILFREVERGSFSSPVEVKSLLTRYSPYSAVYKFCPGIDLVTYEEYRKVVHFDPKSLRNVEYPVIRIDSVSCEIWFQLGKFVKSKIREEESVLCRNCNRLKCDMAHQMKRTQEESPSRKKARCSASSRARLSYMSPGSQDKRKLNAKVKRDSEARKDKYENCEVPLSNEQDEEMNQVMATIEAECQDQLGELFEEGDRQGVGDRMRTIWESDKRIATEQFQRDQIVNSKQHLFACKLSFHNRYRQKK